ncbi:tRNA threonylcarbamoyladenosine dehydratase [Verminephrobacter eiseniae]|uniref:tRNA threonylcarbamoyladenosine dehydratase n=1 Tax=Verminephrobacter eiseniae TaxID=364317 RepID=UPI0022381E96|nr:tRNA threonylcarbamoyladenosine dehydratase [Verminephrobacter eiseniae]MCW5261982.1 tRNA threonylcarbamoyladenosine dehydratase [Verminephrobacter eiseniae]
MPDQETDPERRFGAIRRLYGAQAAARIHRAHIAVVGIGGVGSWAAETLARTGVAQITLIDLDHVTESNINRQIQALTDTVGQAKVLAMRDRIARIHPACKVACIEDFVAPRNWPGLLPTPVDALIDACDQVQAKLTMALWARTAGTWHITVGAAGGKRHAHQVEIDDLARATHDPLLAQLRQRMRRHHRAQRDDQCLRAQCDGQHLRTQRDEQHHRAARDGQELGVTSVFSREPVALPEASCRIDSSLNCHGYGSMVAVTATFGQCAAGWVLDQLATGRAAPRCR